MNTSDSKETSSSASFSLNWNISSSSNTIQGQSTNENEVRVGCMRLSAASALSARGGVRVSASEGVGLAF